MKIKRVIDLTQSPFGLNNNPAFPESKKELCLSYEKNGWMAEYVSFATHSGTHVDAPAHKLEGAPAMDIIPLERFIGEAVILDMSAKRGGEEITADDLAPFTDEIGSGDIVLLYTGWGYKKDGEAAEYIGNSPWLGGPGAIFLKNKEVNAVGIDHFSIGGANAVPAHEILLEAGILIFEELFIPVELLGIKRPLFAAFPVKLGAVSGSPARAVIIEFE